VAPAGWIADDPERRRRVSRPVTVVTYLWAGGRDYVPERVNTLYSMFARHCPSMDRFVCVTDDFGPELFSAGIDVVLTPPIALELSGYTTPMKPHFPSCYRRLYTFSEEAAAWGERLFQTDIDCVVTRSMEPLLDRAEDFVGWRPYAEWMAGHRIRRIGGGSFLLRSGSHADIWRDFIADPQGSIDRALAAGYRGSDQALMSHRLQSCALWDRHCGIYKITDLVDLAEQGRRRPPTRRRRFPEKRPGRIARYLPLPPDARIVHFLGPDGQKPWDYMDWPWVAENWR
jgi:hypothetical protein